MKKSILIFFLAILALQAAFPQVKATDSDFYAYAQSRKNDLRLSTYATAHSIRDAFATDAGKREFISILKLNGVTKVYLEVYRADLVLSNDLLKESIHYLKENGFEVVGGIATVPGEHFARKQEGPLTWCNWQDKKTQDDFREVMKNVAPLFDTFIMDDFLCSSDTSQQSKTARGNQSWSVYRRALMTQMEEEAIIRPAKEANPNLKIIIKYPQWYDRFHLFGYDVETGPKIFDGVWVGTETRGQYTQRYGFVQPYEGFINYRWIAALAGKKIGGAWFDYGDCTAEDFIEQAYQSVLAGAKELVLFSMYDLLTGHPGNHLLRQKFEQLADLSAAVSRSPVVGTMAYKPPQSDAGGDLYLMDDIGMFGVSLIPVPAYPEAAKVLLLPTQAAADKEILKKVEASLKAGARIVMTAGFLATCTAGEKIAGMAGIRWPVRSIPSEAPEIMVDHQPVGLKIPIKYESPLQTVDAKVLLAAQNGGQNIPFLLQIKAGNIFVLNVHTFSEADFNAIGEVLLAPQQLGMFDVPREWANTIRSALQLKEIPVMDAPARVALQQLKDGSCVVQNYNREAVTVKITCREGQKPKDLFTGKFLDIRDGWIETLIPARSGIRIGK